MVRFLPLACLQCLSAFRASLPNEKIANGELAPEMSPMPFGIQGITAEIIDPLDSDKPDNSLQCLSAFRASLPSVLHRVAWLHREGSPMPFGIQGITARRRKASCLFR